MISEKNAEYIGKYLPELHKTIIMNGQDFAEKLKSTRLNGLKKLNILIAEHFAGYTYAEAVGEPKLNISP